MKTTERIRVEGQEVTIADEATFLVEATGEQLSLEQLSDPRVFRLSPFREMGQAPGVIRRFGGAEGLQEMLDELQQRLYAAWVRTSLPPLRIDKVLPLDIIVLYQFQRSGGW